MIIRHDRVGLIPGMQGCFNIQISTKGTHHTNGLGEKKFMIIIIDSEKALEKRQFSDKNHKQTRNRRKLPRSDKERLQKPTANIFLNQERLNIFHLRLRAK